MELLALQLAKDTSFTAVPGVASLACQSTASAGHPVASQHSSMRCMQHSCVGCSCEAFGQAIVDMPEYSMCRF